MTVPQPPPAVRSLVALEQRIKELEATKDAIAADLKPVVEKLEDLKKHRAEFIKLHRTPNMVIFDKFVDRMRAVGAPTRTGKTYQAGFVLRLVMRGYEQNDSYSLHFEDLDVYLPLERMVDCMPTPEELKAMTELKLLFNLFTEDLVQYRT